MQTNSSLHKILNLPKLPINTSLNDIAEALKQNLDVILSASPGAGKSTIVPASLFNAQFLGGKKIIILQPRRVAAVALANRISCLLGEHIGESVGYQVRFNRKIGPKTRIEVLTEGVLTRRLQKDPLLEGVGLVIFDEFHERSVHTDLCLAMCTEIKRELRGDLRLMLMSATADLELPKRFLPNPKIIIGSGFLYPVEIIYKPVFALSATETAKAITEIIMASGAKDEFLVFLPGAFEIKQIERLLLEREVLKNRQILTLYGSMPVEAQERVLNKGEKPRIILSTNIAETSLTIEGVTTVIDTGYRKILSANPNTALNRLELCRISKSSANQRSGRAGRLSSGRAFRLYSPLEYNGFKDFDEPEITLLSPEEPVLELFAWGISPQSFNWLTHPGKERVNKAIELLKMLGAVSEEGTITEIGKKMAELPLEPRLGRMLLSADAKGVLKEAALAAAITAEKDFVFCRAGEKAALDADIEERIKWFYEPSSVPSGLTLDNGAKRQISRVQKQLVEVISSINKGSFKAEAQKDKKSVRSSLKKALLSAFPDRVCMRRGANGAFTICSGQGFYVAQTGLLPLARFILALRLDSAIKRGADAKIFLACQIDENMLSGQKLYCRQRELIFDKSSKKTAARERVKYGHLLINELESQIMPNELLAARRLLMSEAKNNIKEAFALDEPENLSFINRVKTLKRCPAGADFAEINEQWLLNAAESFLYDAKGFDDLQKIRVSELYLSSLSFADKERFEKLVPKTFKAPSGRSVKIKYNADEMPVLAIKLQEMFGVTQTPCICMGQQKLLLHLLSPAMRPVQVTSDLASFWKNTYPQIVKELKGRYPKHPWPTLPTSPLLR